MIAGSARVNPLRVEESVTECPPGLDYLVPLYHSMMPTGSLDEFLWDVVRVLGIDYDLSARDAAKVPRAGGAIVVANRSLGGAEGLVLIAALRRLRHDVKALAHHLPQEIPELSELFIGEELSAHRGVPNVKAIGDAVRWVREGGLLVVFPVGTVAPPPPVHGYLEDLSPNVAHIMRVSGAVVVSVVAVEENSSFSNLAEAENKPVRPGTVFRLSIKDTPCWGNIGGKTRVAAFAP